MPTVMKIVHGVRNALIWAIIAVCLVAYSSSQAAELMFRDGCHQGERTVIAAVGDLIFQRPIQRQIDKGIRSYRSLWKRLDPVVSHADVVYGNLEGPIAEIEGVASKNLLGREGYPLVFGYSTALLDDLLSSGFDVVSTANNHALDRGPRGVDRTIRELKARSLAFTGTRQSDDNNSTWHAITTDGGLRIAWIACTYGTNGKPDKFGQVLHCEEQRAEVLSEISSLADDPTIDAVILTPHWGLEDTTLVEPGQESLARQAISNGVTVIIGAHPHVLQRWEKFPMSGGGEGLVLYSLGNFVSAQPSLAQRTGVIALIELAQTNRDRKAQVVSARYIVTKIEPHPNYDVSESFDQNVATVLPAGNRITIADIGLVRKKKCRVPTKGQ